MGGEVTSFTLSTTSSTTNVGEFPWATGWVEGDFATSSTTSSTTPDGRAAHDELGDYSPDATVEEMESLTLQELVDQELLGGANQSGQLLMELDQHPSEFAVVNEPAPNRPTTVDWSHDVLHNLAQRVLNDTIGAQRYGHPPTVRWGAHVAAAEFRDVGRMFTRLGDMIVNSIDRPVDEPRTAPPTNEPMYRHYRDWSRRWREMFWDIVREFVQHTDAEVLEHLARLRARDEHYQRMEELRELERYRTAQRTGPDPGLGVPVARRPVGTMGGKRSHEQMATDIGERGRSSTDTLPSHSPLDVAPPRPKFRMPMPSPEAEMGTMRPPQTPDPRPHRHSGSGSALGNAGTAMGVQRGGAVATWDESLASLSSSSLPSGSASLTGWGTMRPVPITPMLLPAPNPATPTPPAPVSELRPPVSSFASQGVRRPSVWEHHNNPGTPTIPTTPIVTADTPVTPFDDRGIPITPTIPSAPVITSATPVTPNLDDVPEVDDVIQEICGASSSSTTTTRVFPLILLISTTSSTTPRSLEEEVDYDELDDHPPSDEVTVTVEEEGEEVVAGEEGGDVREREMIDGGGGVNGGGLSARDERLAQHVAGLVVAELYHLLRTTGVIPGPTTPVDRDVRVTPRGVMGASRPTRPPPWRLTSRRAHLLSPYAAGPGMPPGGPPFSRSSTTSTTTELDVNSSWGLVLGPLGASVVSESELWPFGTSSCSKSATSSPMPWWTWAPSSMLSSTSSPTSASSPPSASLVLAWLPCSRWVGSDGTWWRLLRSVFAMLLPRRSLHVPE